MEKTGTCAYCHQSMMIETVGEVSQEEVDIMVTEKCKCPEAATARRKKERKEKIDRFIKRQFDPDTALFIRTVIKMVEDEDICDFSCKFPDERVTKIWLDSKLYLHIQVKKNLDDELTV